MANPTQPQYIPVAQPTYQPQVATVAPPQRAPLPQGYTSESQKKSVKITAVMQILIGALCIIFQIINTSMYYIHETYPGYRDYNPQNLSVVDGYIAGGIWIGAFYTFTGIVGLVSTKKKSNCWVILFLVLNIIQCTLMVWVLIGLTAASLGMLEECKQSEYNSHDYDYRFRFIEYYCNENLRRASLAFSSLMMILSFAQFVIAIVSSVFGCCATCCRTSNNPTQVAYYPQYQYAPQGYVMYPPGQPMAAPVVGVQHPVGYASQPLQLAPGQAPPYSPGTSQPQNTQSHVASAPTDEKPPAYGEADTHYEEVP